MLSCGRANHRRCRDGEGLSPGAPGAGILTGEGSYDRVYPGCHHGGDQGTGGKDSRGGPEQPPCRLCPDQYLPFPLPVAGSAGEGGRIPLLHEVAPGPVRGAADHDPGTSSLRCAGDPGHAGG